MRVARSLLNFCTLLLRSELAMVDTSDRTCAHWLEPILKGDVPVPRKACAAAATGNTIVLFGGQTQNADGEATVTGDLVIMEVTGPNSIQCAVNPAAPGASGSPAARYGAVMQEFSNGERVPLYMRTKIAMVNGASSSTGGCRGHLYLP